MDCVKTGEFISQLRKEKGLTQKQLAERINVTDKAVSRWETGKGYPDIKTLSLLSQELGVTLNELLSGDRIPDENKEAVAEKNIEIAFHQTKVIKNKSRFIISAVCVVAIIFCCVFGHIIKKNSNIDRYSTEISSTNIEDVSNEVSAFVNKHCIIGTETVCTYFDVNIGKDFTVESMDIQINDPDYHRFIQVKVQKENKKLSCNITQQYEYLSEQDGIVFDKAFSLFKYCDFISLAQNFSENKNFNKVNIYFLSTLQLTFDENRLVHFGEKQHLFKNDEVKNVRSSVGMDGKYYEVIISADTDYTSCCSIYVKR